MSRTAEPGRACWLEVIQGALLAVVLVTAGCPKGSTRLPANDGKVDPKARALKTVNGLVVLERDLQLDFDERGALTKTVTLRYLFKTKEAVDRYDGVGANWSPWYQQRPVLMASVRTPDGKVHVLDPATVAVQPVTSGHRRILTDRRRLHAKLPSLEVGAIAVLRIIYREKRPLVAAGAVYREGLAEWLPTHKARLEISAPEARPLHVALRGYKAKPKRDEISGGRRHLVYEVGPFTKNELWEPLMTYDRPRVPYLLVSTAKSWGAVASAYRKRVHRQLRHGAAARVVAEVRRRVGKGRLALVAGLLRKLRDKLRYTSLAFGDKAIVPVRPATALRRGYGDCKDMSTVLVTWLRAAGIPAYLALLRAGTDEDVTPSHPGLDLFNHAIVYVPAGDGERALWLDPTSKYGSPRWASWTAQGRWALVIRRGVKALAKIPASSPADNLYREVRQVWFQRTRGARVAETSVTTGIQEVGLRALVDGPDAKTFRKNMVHYIKGAYHTKELTKVKHTDPRDLSKPFVLRLEMKGAEAFWTDDNHARAKLNTNPVWMKAGGYAMNPPPPGSKHFKRRTPVEWPSPFHAELVFRLTAPPRYVLKSRLESGYRKLGPATFSWTVRVTPGDGKVEVRYRFNLGKRVWQANELLAFWRGLWQLRQELGEAEVVFEHRGRRLIRKGKLRQALDLYRALHRRHPDSPTYYRQLANAYGELGYGLRARAMLRLAAKRFPKDAYTHLVLGMYLESDGYGNSHEPGSDLAGARREYATACRLDNKNAQYLVTYARSLTYDSRGRFLRGAKALGPAIRAYRRLRTELKHKAEDLPYAWVLLRARKLDDLRKELPSLKLPKLRKGINLALQIVRHGAGSALRRAGQLAGRPSEVPRIIMEATSTLLELGRFSDAATMLISLNRLVGGSAKDLAQLKRLRSYAFVERSATTPERVTMWLLRRAVADRLTATFFSRELAAKGLGTKGRKDLLKRLGDLAEVKRNDKSFGGFLSADVAADLLLADLRFEVEGDDRTGYRVTARNDSDRSLVYRAFLVKEGGRYRVRASWQVPAEMGAEALARVRRNDLVGARKWLDWQRGSDAAHMSPYYGSAFSHFWETGVRYGKRRIRTAAAVVASQSAAHRKRALRILQQALSRGPDRELRIQLLRSLRAVNSELGRYRDAAKATAKLWKLSHRAQQLLLPYIHDLLSARQYRKAQRVANKYLKRHPARVQGLYALALIANARKRFDETKKQYDAILARKNVKAYYYNNRAWLGLFLKPFNGRQSLELAKRATEMTRGRDASSQDTLAAIGAEVGELGTARKAFKKTLAILGWKKPQKHAWYVYGRIAEQLGLLAEARDAYRRVPKPKQPQPTATYFLAQRRLKLMPKTVTPRAPLRVAPRRRRPRPARRPALPRPLPR